MAILKSTIINGSLTISDNDTSIDVGLEIQTLWNTISNIQSALQQRPTYGSAKLLWTGTANNGAVITLNSEWTKYRIFAARTSDGATMCVGARCINDDNSLGVAIRFANSLDTGSGTYHFVGGITVKDASANTFTVGATSKHILSSAATGYSLTLKNIYGII